LIFKSGKLFTLTGFIASNESYFFNKGLSVLFFPVIIGLSLEKRLLDLFFSIIIGLYFGFC